LGKTVKLDNFYSINILSHFRKTCELKMHSLRISDTCDVLRETIEKNRFLSTWKVFCVSFESGPRK